MIDLRFMFERFAPLALELSQVLGVRFVPGDPSNDTPIGQALSSILTHQNVGDFANRNSNYFRMLTVQDDLQTIKQASPQTFETFRRLLLDRNYGNYLGTRFEIQIAANLIRSGLSFQKRSKGGPDFALKGEYLGLGIECASLHFTDGAKAPYSVEKLRQLVAQKSAKPYASRDCVLAVEITNLQSLSQSAGLALLSDSMDLVGKMADSCAFGGIALFWATLAIKDGEVIGIGGRHAGMGSDDSSPRLREAIMTCRLFPGSDPPPDSELHNAQEWRSPIRP